MADLREQLKEARKAYEKSRAKYRKALKAKNEAEKVLRAACETASADSNLVAALDAAVSKLPAEKAAEAVH